MSFEEQRKRFEARNAEPLKRWKLSDMDLAEHEHYVRYSMAKDTTFQYTDIKQAPWYVVPSDDKKAARLNCISHLLSQFDYVDVAPDVVELPEMRQEPYVRPPMHEQTFVPALVLTHAQRSRRAVSPWMRPSVCASRSPLPPQRPAMISAAMLIAVSSGVRAPRSRPIGLDSRASSSSVRPASFSRAIRSSCVRREPIAPTYASSGRRSATSSSGTSNLGSWVSTVSTVRGSIRPASCSAVR